MLSSTPIVLLDVQVYMLQSWQPARRTQPSSWLGTATWLPSRHWCSQVTSSMLACKDADVGTLDWGVRYTEQLQIAVLS